MALALLIISLPIIYLFLKIFHFQTRHQLPPGPNSLLVMFTYLPQLIHNPHIALQNMAKIYGPLASFKLGDKLVVVASSPDAAKKLFRAHDRVFSGRHSPSVYHKLPGNADSSILMSSASDASWKLLRSIGRRTVFSSRAMESANRIRKAKVVDMVGRVRAKEGEIVRVEDLMFGTLANIISSVLTSRNLFDIDGGDDHDDDFREISDLVNEVIEKMITLGGVDFLPFLKGVDFWSERKARDLYGKIKLIWGGIVDERRLTGRERYSDSTPDFLDILLEDGTFSDDQIANALMELLIAATDSSTSTTVWLMTELIRNPEPLSIVRSEIAPAFAGDEPSDALLSECRYFQACIKETLRLHVPAPLLVPHRATEACAVNGYVIPKDSMVLVNAWGVARDPSYWEDAAVFKPERFLGSKTGYRGTHFEYLPFGTGVRMCPGINVALSNVERIVGSLLHYFDWSLPDGEDIGSIDMREKYMTTLKKEKPLLLVPKLREGAKHS